MVTEYENSLRQLIIKFLGSENLSSYQVSDKRIQNWKEKREIEEKKLKGVMSENRLIYYSDFYDLQTIIHKNWEVFQEVFHEKKRFDIFFSEMEKFRNTIAHGRHLTSSQENLLKGITADLKNQITIFHNKNEMKEDYFIRITKVTDNLGNIWPDAKRIKPTLRVGDEYELVVEANDPKDRDIYYRLAYKGYEILKNQKSNRLKFTVSKNMITPHAAILAYASTPSEKEYTNEDCEVLIFSIIPS